MAAQSNVSGDYCLYKHKTSQLSPDVEVIYNLKTSGLTSMGLTSTWKATASLSERALTRNRRKFFGIKQERYWVRST